MRVLTTLLRPDGGRAAVAGCDVVSDARRLRSRIGLCGQYAAVDDHLIGVGLRRKKSHPLRNSVDRAPGA